MREFFTIPIVILVMFPAGCTPATPEIPRSLAAPSASPAAVTTEMGSVTLSIGSRDPGASNTVKVGTKEYHFSSIKLNVGSKEDVVVEEIRFTRTGSAVHDDLDAVYIYVNGESQPTSYPIDPTKRTYYDTTFYHKTPNVRGLVVRKGENVEISIYGDIMGGIGHDVAMDIIKKSDIVIRGMNSGQLIVAGGGSAGPAAPGSFSSTNTPFHKGYTATIDRGSLLVSASSKVTSGNVPVDVTDTVIGGFLLDVKGEPVEISSLTLNLIFTGTGTWSDMTDVKIVREDGTLVAGPRNPSAGPVESSGTMRFGETWTLPVGKNHLFVKAKLDRTFVRNDTVQITVDPDDQITARGKLAGLPITASPTTKVVATPQIVK